MSLPCNRRRGAGVPANRPAKVESEARGLEKRRFAAGRSEIEGGVWKSRTRTGLVWTNRPGRGGVWGVRRPARFCVSWGGDGGWLRSEVAAGQGVGNRRGWRAGVISARSHVHGSCALWGVDFGRPGEDNRSQVGILLTPAEGRGGTPRAGGERRAFAVRNGSHVARGRGGAGERRFEISGFEITDVRGWAGAHPCAAGRGRGGETANGRMSNSRREEGVSGRLGYAGVVGRQDRGSPLRGAGGGRSRAAEKRRTTTAAPPKDNSRTHRITTPNTPPHPSNDNPRLRGGGFLAAGVSERLWYSWPDTRKLAGSPGCGAPQEWGTGDVVLEMRVGPHEGPQGDIACSRKRTREHGTGFPATG